MCIYIYKYMYIPIYMVYIDSSSGESDLFFYVQHDDVAAAVRLLASQLIYIKINKYTYEHKCI